MEYIGKQIMWTSFSELKSSNNDIFWSFLWLDKFVYIENELFHWGSMVTFKFEYNGVEIKSFNAKMTKLKQYF
jgi:hypothetical protein